MISYTTYHLICFKTFAYIFKRFYLPSHVIQFIIKTEVELLLIKKTSLYQHCNISFVFCDNKGYIVVTSIKLHPI